jgi:hypothetical protein
MKNNIMIKVLVIEEKFPFNIVEHARWLYTAVTRASERWLLLKNERDKCYARTK